VLTVIFLGSTYGYAQQSAGSLSAEEIVRRLEATRTFETSRVEMTMTVEDRFGRRVSRMTAWSRGAEDSLIEFTSPAERGQKVLRTEDEIYLFYPDAAELVRLQGAALRESMLGSDVSYEDLTGGRSILDDYDVTLEGEETIDGAPVYVVALEARSRRVAYPRQTLWIDADMFATRRTEQSALNGRLLKTVTSDQFERIEGTWVARRTVISDALKRNSSTTVEVTTIEVGLPLDPALFSLAELSW
jgi:outer membrane lipoprotein-sorting protein